MSMSKANPQGFHHSKQYSVRINKLKQESIDSQKRTFTKWINQKIKNRRPLLKVNDLFTDLCDGQILLALLEVFTRRPFPSEGTSRIQSMNNINKVLKHLKDVGHLKLYGITIEGILDGTPNVILGLVWSMIHLYSLINLDPEKLYFVGSSATVQGSSVESLTTGQNNSNNQPQSITNSKQKFLKWTNRKMDSINKLSDSNNELKNKIPFKLRPIKNFKNDWRDGRAFANLIFAIDQAALGNVELLRRDFETRDNKSNLKATFQIAEEKLGIPQLLVPEGKFVILYSIYFIFALDDRFNSVSVRYSIKFHSKTTKTIK